MKTFDELWPLPAPEIVVVTGPFGCGKSTFTLGTGATPERTVVIDFEKSQRSFAAQLPLKYVDMQAEMAAKFPAGYKLTDLFERTVAIVDAFPAGAQDVIVLDNASPLEDAIAAYVEAHAGEFGHSLEQFRAMSGLKWGDVKAKYQQLLTRWVSKARMIFIVVHLRDKWVGNSIQKDAFGKPVQEPKGKETLDQLSSLFVWLETGAGGIPAGRVLKCRVDRKVYVSDPENPPAGIPAAYLAELNGDPGVVSVPVLPLRLPKCTWPAIREYMRNPADLANPKPGEMPKDEQLSEDDRLRLRAIISQNDAEKAGADRLKRERRASPPAEQPGQTEAGQKTERPMQPATLKEKLAQKAAALEKEGSICTESDRRMVAANLNIMFAGEPKPDTARHAVLEYLVGSPSVNSLTECQVMALRKWINAKPDSGGEYQPDSLSTQEARLVLANAGK
jgi:hypothetical protein